MLHKLKQQVKRYRLTTSNRVPNRRSREFLLNLLRFTRKEKPSGAIRASMGLLRWALMASFHGENRISYRRACLLSGRDRGTSQRFSVSRVKVKHLAASGKLFGLRKSSW